MKFFDKLGCFIGTLPQECVDACSHSGSCDEGVAFWRKKLDFAVPREKTIEYLKEYGAWTVEELTEKSDEDLAELVLWLACGEIQDGIDWAGVIH